MERGLHSAPFWYKKKIIMVQRTPVWLFLSPERLSNTFPETGRGAGVAFPSVLCGSHHRNKGTFQAGTLRPGGAAPRSPRAQDFTGHQDLPMCERKGNTHSSGARTLQTGNASSAIIPSASPSLSIPDWSFICSLAPPENRSLLLQGVIAYHTWLAGAEGSLPWCQEDALQVPAEVEAAPWSNLGGSELLQLQTSLSRDLFHRER